jgi:hypothetical protein
MQILVGCTEVRPCPALGSLLLLYRVGILRSHDNEQGIRQIGVVVEGRSVHVWPKGSGGVILDSASLEPCGLHKETQAKRGQVQESMFQRWLPLWGLVYSQDTPRTQTTHYMTGTRGSSLPSSLLPGRPHTTRSCQIIGAQPLMLH